MKENPFLLQGSRGCGISLALILSSLFAMTISVYHRYPEQPSCGGMLGAGFPVLFICDDWGGGSPSNSWGRITPIDIINGGIRPTGFFIDFLFYFMLVWIAWLVAARFFRKPTNYHGLWWAAFISLGFLCGLLGSFLTYQSSSLYLGDYYYYASATPIVPSPTAFGTMPSELTPIPTAPP
jgi:hypothetical protein